MSIKLQGGLGNQMMIAAYGLSRGCRTFDITNFDTDSLRKYELDQYDLDIELVRDQEAEQGYFQNEGYFNHELIRKLFARPKGVPNDKCIETACTIAKWPSVFIGVRRADYLWPERINYHGVMDISYYQEAVRRFPKGTRFFVFSDDLPWARETFEDFDIVDVNGPNEKAWDIWLMSICKGAIIANSTFHWWGAWLGNSEKVIAPRKWFAKDIPNDGIVPERWVKI